MKNESSSGFIMSTFPLDVVVDAVNVAVVVDVAVVGDVDVALDVVVSADIIEIGSDLIEDTPNKYSTNNTIFFHILI